MKPTRILITKPTAPLFARTPNLAPNKKWVHHFGHSRVKFQVSMAASSTHNNPLSSHASSPAVMSDIGSHEFGNFGGKLMNLEENIEKGCTCVVASFQEYLVNRGKVIFLLVEAIDVYLLGTVMLVFGMGLYELFISNLDVAKSMSSERTPHRSNLFGLFTLKERPRWLEIKSVNELKTKLGHVIVMLLLIGFLDKSKKALIQSSTDLLCFSASVLLSSGCLYLLSRLNGSK